MATLSNKISIIGAGFVGSTIAYTLMINGIASELVIVDVNKEKALGEAMDLRHGISFVSPVKVIAGDYKDIQGSDIVVVTAGANQKPGETRLDLVKKNTDIFKAIIPQIVKYAPDSIILVVTNPVDILTYVTYKISGFPKNRVLGSGTVLDTSRFRYSLSEHTGIDSRNIHAYILGEHGDSEVAIWSKTNIAGMSMDEFCEHCKKCGRKNREEIITSVKNAAYEIISRKGATYYAVALAVNRIIECILRNEHSILTVSSIVNGEYGINDISLSLPSVVTRNGVQEILEISLNEAELNSLNDSSKVLKNTIKSLNI